MGSTGPVHEGRSDLLTEDGCSCDPGAGNEGPRGEPDAGAAEWEPMKHSG